METKNQTQKIKQTAKNDVKSKSVNNQKKPKIERQYLTATTIVAGIISLIDENGELKYYRQRGITNLPDEFKTMLVSVGFLNRNWYTFKELPKHITIKFEDEVIMGKASATFPAKQAAYILNSKIRR